MALKSDGSISAWGHDKKSQVSDRPTKGVFKLIAAGGQHGLAMKPDGSLVCWGSNDHGQVTSTPTKGVFTAISAGWGYNLALKPSGPAKQSGPTKR